MLKTPYCQAKSKDLPSCRPLGFLRQSVDGRNENPRRHAAEKPFRAFLTGWLGGASPRSDSGSSTWLAQGARASMKGSPQPKTLRKDKVAAGQRRGIIALQIEFKIAEIIADIRPVGRGDI